MIYCPLSLSLSLFFGADHIEEIYNHVLAYIGKILIMGHERYTGLGAGRQPQYEVELA